MAKINEVVGMKNRVTVGGRGKRIVRPFIRQEFSIFIGCLILEVTNGSKGHNLWSDLPKYSCKIALLNYEDMFVGTPIYIR